MKVDACLYTSFDTVKVAMILMMRKMFFVVSDGYFLNLKIDHFAFQLPSNCHGAQNVLGHNSSWIKLHSSSL